LLARYSPVYAFQKQPSMIDCRGHLSALFFVSGCNFSCGFCHNISLMKSRKQGIEWTRLEQVCQSFKDNWVSAVTITGGEPTLHPGLLELISFLRRFGFYIKLDSNGSAPHILERIINRVDYIAMDLKCSLEGYKTLTGYKDTSRILESTKLLKSNAKDYEFRTTIISSVHSPNEIKRMQPLYEGAKRFVFQPFIPHPDLFSPKFRKLERTQVDLMKDLAIIAMPHVRHLDILGN
jgi:pyruvate formate lyase activating enzyme